MSLSTGLAIRKVLAPTITNGAIRDCPHCGGRGQTTDLRIGEYNDDEAKAQLWRVICQLCGASSGPVSSEGEAVRAWNQRM